MANFDNGVKDYVRATATVLVAFPVDWSGKTDVCCRQCPYLTSNERMCQLNKEPVAYPAKYVGQNCPLIEVEKEED